VTDSNLPPQTNADHATAAAAESTSHPVDFVQLDKSQLASIGRVDLVLNRSQRRNALTRAMLQDLLEAIREIQASAAARVLVLRARGPVFCAGMDLGEMQRHAAAPDKEAQWELDSRLYYQLLSQLFQLPIPTVAQVQGPVLAGGVGLVLACDLVLASSESFFSLPEPARGITAAMVTPFLVYRIGAGPAGQWLLSGQRVAAEAALRVGLCYDVVAAQRLSGAVDDLVRSILVGSPQALAMTKKHWQACGAAEQVLRQAEMSIAVSAQARETTDAREGLAAFLEKRPPAWAPRP